MREGMESGNIFFSVLIQHTDFNLGSVVDIWLTDPEVQIFQSNTDLQAYDATRGAKQAPKYGFLPVFKD